MLLFYRNSVTAPLFGCAIVDLETHRSTRFMREPSEFYIMLIFPCLNNYLYYQELSQFIIEIYNFYEIYKALNNLSSPFLSELFQVKDLTYNLRKGDILVMRDVKTKNYGTDSISYLEHKIWKLIPEVIRNSKSLNIFKYKIGSWVPEKCPCHLCKIYIQNLGYL